MYLRTRMFRLLMQPTYDGLYANISEIIKICDSAGTLFIVEGAWCHLPEKPLQHGASIFLKSTHKIEGSLQSGTILVYKKNVDEITFGKLIEGLFQRVHLLE